jgi:hypothetical protein
MDVRRWTMEARMNGDVDAVSGTEIIEDIDEQAFVLASDYDTAKAECDRLNALINNPHTSDFLEAVRTEAAHQRERWASDHDAGKTDVDWLWLIGYLVGKAVHKPEKRLHHIITTAAACLNWHAARSGVDTRMRPGIEPPE